MEQRYQHKPIRYWLFACMMCVLLMVVIGGYTRLTESGLSMVTWKPVQGVIPPITMAEWQDEFALYQQTPEFKLHNSTMTLSEFKQIFYVEYIHRMAGRFVGIVFLLPFVYFLFRKRFTGLLTLRLLGIFTLGALQGFMGWWMVKSGLQSDPFVSPIRLSLHLGLATIILGFLTHTLVSLSSFKPITLDGGTHRLIFTVAGLLFLQILLGGLVAGHKAGLIYNSFPMMDGAWLPYDSWHLTPWYRNVLEDPTTIQWLHRTCAYLLFGFSMLLLARAILEVKQERLIKMAVLLFVLINAQMMLGIFTLLWYVPLSIALLHQLGAMLIWMVMIALLSSCEREKTS